MPRRIRRKGRARPNKNGKQKKKRGPRGIGALLGGAIGTKFGQPKAGAWLGNLAQTGLSKLFGRGDYEVVSPDKPVNGNSLISPAKQVPIMNTDTMGAIRISHREFLTDVQGNTGTNTQSYRFTLNPGDSRTFPWLSNLSSSFEQWKLLGLCFEFKSTCGNAVSSSNSALGTVCVATQYDALSTPFGAKTDILNHFWSGSAKPSLDQLHCVECEPSQTPTAPLYIRNQGQLGKVLGGEDEIGWAINGGGVPTSMAYVTFQEAFDARLYDHGRFEMLITGQQAQFNVGELWVSYDMLLLKPRRTRNAERRTFDAPPPGPEIEDGTMQHFPAVPLMAVLPLNQNPADYPTELGEVDYVEGKEP